MANVPRSDCISGSLFLHLAIANDRWAFTYGECCACHDASVLFWGIEEVRQGQQYCSRLARQQHFRPGPEAHAKVRLDKHVSAGNDRLSLGDWAEDYVWTVLMPRNSAHGGKLRQQSDLGSNEWERRFHAA